MKNHSRATTDLLSISLRAWLGPVLAAGCLSLGIAPQPAFAQDQSGEVMVEESAEEGLELLTSLQQRLVEAGSFSADIAMTAEIEQAFARDLLPSAEGRMIALANEDDQWRVRISGTTTPLGQKDETQFDVMWADDVVTTVEYPESKVIKGPERRVRGSLFSTVRRLQIIPGLNSGEAPFAPLLTNVSTTIKLVGEETVDGIACQMIHATVGSGRRAQNYSIALRSDDMLPVRIMMHPQGFDQGPAVGTLFKNFALGGVSADEQAWTIETPEGFELEEIKAPERSAAKPQLTEQGESAEAQDAMNIEGRAARHQGITPSYAMSPAWSFETREGESFSRESLKGKTSVLYFWGTWCIPCRRAAPLNLKLWEDLGDNENFEMIGLAVRERDVDAAYEYAEKNNYAWTQFVGADDIAAKFEVKRYPAWFVIGPAGEILHESGSPQGGDFEPIFEKMRRVIDASLAKSSDKD